MSLSSLFGNWLGALVAGVISFAAAWILRGIDKNQKFNERRLDLSEQTISHLSHYIENWRRLITISQFAQGRDLTEKENERLSRYVTDRDKAKSELVACINILPLFFGDDVLRKFAEFRKWDSAHSALRVNDLPHIEEWEKWQYKLCKLLKKSNLN